MNWIFEAYSNIYNTATLRRPEAAPPERPEARAPWKRTGWRGSWVFDK